MSDRYPQRVVWMLSKAKGQRLLVLLALADLADTQGEAHASAAYLACMTRLKLPATRRALRTLLATGELSQVSDDGPHGVNAYRINLPDPNPTTQGPTQP